MQWMVPVQRLGEEQVAVLDGCLKHTGNSHITGHAGTGKTVILIHALREYLTRNPDDSVCVVLYTHSLIELVRTGIPDFLGSIPVMTYYQFMRQPRHYDMILVDEVQDLKYEALSSVARYSNRCIVAGDKNQSIYGDCVSADDIRSLIEPRVSNLEILYRMPQTIRDIAQTILPDAGLETARINKGENVEVTLANAESSQDEIKWVWKQAKRYAVPGQPSAILLPHHADIISFISHVCRITDADLPSFEVDQYGRNPDYNIVNRHLSANDISLMYLGNQYGSLDDSDGRPLTYVLTYHSAKGLDFKTVFLPHLTPSASFGHGDSARDRRVFFVGATRSRRELFLTYSGGHAHSYINAMPQDLLHKVQCRLTEAEAEENDFTF